MSGKLAPLMERRRRLRSIAIVGLIAAAMRLTLGAQWFSLYGWAVTVLAALVPLGSILLDGARRRWPVWLLITFTALVALIQIGYWLTFFHGGPTGLFLGIGRSMIRPELDVMASTGAGVLLLIWLLVMVRALMRHGSAKKS